MPALARKHRVHLLLADSMAREERDRPDLLEPRTRAAHGGSTRCRPANGILTALLTALVAAGIDALLLKGSALAYLVYAAPHLRPRVDIDLMICRDALDRAERRLRGARMAASHRARR